MDLTISIVAFQSRKFLRELLDSILKSETNYSWEVILVDNGSTDGTAEMLEKDFLSNAQWQGK